MASRCSFCGTTDGPFLEVQGLFPLLMCPACQAARASSNRGPDQAAEFLAHHDRDQPWYKWGCPLPGCGYWVILPWDLEAHATADHIGWVAHYELVRPYRTSTSGSCSGASRSHRRADAHSSAKP